jgi:hypothetical protein
MRASFFFVAVPWLAILSGAGVAWADVAPPNFSNCLSKNAGDVCDLENPTGQPTGQQGRCADSQCSSTHPAPFVDGSAQCPDGASCTDGSTVFATTHYACKLCTAANDAGAGGSTGAGGAATGAGGAAPGAGGAAPGAGGAATGAGGAAGTTTAAPAPAPAEESSGCAVQGNLTRTVGPWALAGSLSVLLLLKRRRRR